MIASIYNVQEFKRLFFLICLVPYLLLSGNCSLLRHVNSVKELTKILMSNIGGLLDLCASHGNHSNVISDKLNLILDISGSYVGNSLRKWNLTYTTLSQEVTDLNVVSVTGNIDGEMRVYKTHLVDESSGNSNHHVINVRDSGTYACKLLTGSEPKINTNVLSSDNLEVHIHVLEITGESSTGSSYGDNAGFDNNLNCWNKMG